MRCPVCHAELEQTAGGEVRVIAIPDTREAWEAAEQAALLREALGADPEPDR
jgi:hypothetical protein